MSDRKYRQRGYQDDARERERAAPKGPKPAVERAPGRQLQDASGPKTPNLMASHEVFRCARCGNRLAVPVDAFTQCSRCGVAVHSCIHCLSFDTSARWECTETIPARIASKDERNSCSFFQPRMTVERQTGTPAGPPTARQAFDDLFK